MAKRAQPIPYIWSQDSEDRAKADCGCTLEDDYEGYPAFWQCPLHNAAPMLLAALNLAHSLLANMLAQEDYPVSSEAGEAIEHIQEALSKAIQQAEGRE